MHIVGNEDADLKTVIELGEFTASQAKTPGDLREIMHTQPRYYMSMLRTPSTSKKCLYSELFYFIFPCVQTQYREIKYLSVFSPNAGKYGPEQLRIQKLFMERPPSSTLSLHMLQLLQKMNTHKRLEQILEEHGLEKNVDWQPMSIITDKFPAPSYLLQEIKCTCIRLN